MKEFTFLTKEQVDVFNSVCKYGGMAEVTDFSILLRGAGGKPQSSYYGKNEITGKITGCYWTKSEEYIMPYYERTLDDYYAVYFVDNDADCRYCSKTCNIKGARPVVSYSAIRPFCSNITRSEVSRVFKDTIKAYNKALEAYNKVLEPYNKAWSQEYLDYLGSNSHPYEMSEYEFYQKWKVSHPKPIGPAEPIPSIIDDLACLEVCYGEYPQTIVDEDYSSVLEEAYNKGTLRTTGKAYSAASREIQGFYAVATVNKNYIEYEYNGSKYIRFIANSNCYGLTLSNGVKVKAGNIYWVRVEPIVWIVFAGNDLAFSKKIIFDGVPFTKNSGELYMDNFKKSFIYEFMNNYFAKEIIADRSSSRGACGYNSSKDPEEDANKRVRKM